MDWMRVAADLKDHPKALKLGILLGKERAHSYILDLWGWATRFHKDGDLTDCDALDISVACGWTGDPEQFKAALISARLIDDDDDVLLIHDWSEHQGKLIEQAEAASERTRAWRERMRTVRVTNAKRTRNERKPYEGTNERTNERTNEQNTTTWDRFKVWWATYPRHEAKANAEKAWAKLTEEERAECMTRSPEWIEAKRAAKTEERFYPLPATYLNGKRWRDEIQPKQAAATTYPPTTCRICAGPALLSHFGPVCAACLASNGTPEWSIRDVYPTYQEVSNVVTQ